MNIGLALLFLAIGAAAETVARKAFSFKRTAEEKPHKRFSLKTQMNETFKDVYAKNKAKHEYAEHEIEVWYINQAKRADRRSCIEGQLQAMGIEPHRFEALEPKEEDLKEGGKYADCVKAGLLKGDAYIDATAGGISKSSGTKRAIIGNTCSHKRLFQQLAENKNSTAKYFVVLEDDAILNPLKFKTAINQFVDENWGYKGKFYKDFQMVQLDFIGSFCTSHRVGRFGGKRVFKPKDIFKPGYGGADCARYFGAQALLMQKDTLMEVVEHMETHKVEPMDWVQGSLPKALAWRPQIARSPIQKFNKLPTFCSGKTRISSISNGNSVDSRSFRRVNATEGVAELPEKQHQPVKLVEELDINSWMDAFKSETKADDANDDVKANDDGWPNEHEDVALNDDDVEQDE